MRLFVAAEIPDEIKAAIERDVVGPLRAGLSEARWTRPEGRHLTLKFLGEVADDRVDAIREALAGVAVGRCEAAFDRVGGFPSLKRPRVLWIGIGPGADALTELASAVDGALARVGFDAERRPYRAHVTLARFRQPGPVDTLPAVEVPTAAFDVPGFVLFRSQLHPQGARYTVLGRFAPG